jgi:hypothetical protein
MTHQDEKPKAHPPAPHERTKDEERLHRHRDELLDQGVEETFPASDPVAVKHIT